MKKAFLTIMVFAFIANVSAQLKVDATGQVGIGTTTPQYKLDVNGDIHVDGNIYLESDSNLIATTNNVPLQFKVNGVLAGSTGSSGKYNVSFGYRALSATTSNNYNTAIGYYALTSNTTGGYNTASGANALYSNTSGNCNTASGYYALRTNTTGGYNTASGYYALYSNTTGYYNTASGYYALRANTSGYYNTANGSYALSTNSTGSNNTANGYYALRANTTGSSNTASGSYALYSNTTGTNNTASGYYALRSNTTGNYNTASGNSALYTNTTGSYNTASGYSALYANTTGINNTASGYNALYANTTGSDNTADGHNVLYSNTTGDDNTAGGYYALYDNTTGGDNTAYGHSALSNNTTGDGNTAYGKGALSYNTTGTNNTAIGYNANVDATDLENATAIGFDAEATSSDQVMIGNLLVSSIGGYSDWETFSDKRAKQNIVADVPGLDFINRLQPVTYNLDLDVIDGLLNSTKNTGELKDSEKKAKEAKEKKVETGFLAQDVEEAAQSIGYDFNGVNVDRIGIYKLRYAKFVVPLVKAVQELSEQNKLMQAQINELLQEKATLRSGNAAESVTGLQDVANSGAYLQQNSPNPFNQSTQIKYYLPATVKTAFLCIYDLQGVQLKQTAIQERGEGVQTLYGSELKAGIYLYSLIADGQEVDTKRMILTK